ncbi:MAG: thioredoxin family protein [Pirellulales bacterium]|nr:thioredoxin family protein [Pirellulales bacterium]
MRRFVPFALVWSLGVLALASLLPSPLLAYQFPGEEESPIKVSAQFTAATADQPAKLFITAKIAEPWHIYSITQKKGGPLPTKITLAPSDAYLVDAEFRASPAPEKRTEPDLYGDLVIEEHTEEVTWWAPIEFANGIDPRALTINGKINVQACNDESCLPPKNYSFTAVLGDGVEVEEEAPDAVAADGASIGMPPVGPAAPTFDPNQLQIVGDDELANMPIWLALCAGLAGGMLLNLMPCVLPVIGLKILAFVEQSHHQRSKVLLLNVWYSLGLLSVFMILASLAVFAGFGWGQLFTLPEFNVVLAGVVFAMALSFLGVWEIPIPGFAGGTKAHELSSQEGAFGAFTKGAITTVLATPCTGPFLGTALAWAIRQPAYLTYAVFASVALGMASPYLLIGMFPRFIRWLPKPGAWMDTFKQLMGFVLLATLVYLFSFIQTWYMVPTFALLMGIWLACWWIGRTPGYAPLPARVRAWAEAVAVVSVVAFLSFTWLGEEMRGRFALTVDREIAARVGSEGMVPVASNHAGLAWQPFTRANFDRLVSENKTVLVDFTADWCLVCKTLEATVLSTDEVRKVVDTNQIVPLQADWTHQAPEVTEMLTQLGSKQVPVLAIFPAGRPNSPIVLRDTYTTNKLLAALEEAGPSKGAGPAASTAMNRP